MALRDHSLDDKIIDSAKKEFLKHGFQKASLHKIAENAGTTTGALYTRYKNKDDLFCSLLKPVFKIIRLHAEPLKEMYEDVLKSVSVENMLEAIRKEKQVYLDVLFTNYEECVLFFCKNTGSSIETMLLEMTERKATETLTFLKKISKKELDFDGIEMIMTVQFDYYRQILLKGYSKEKAIRCMNTVETFLECGWKDLFEKIL